MPARTPGHERENPDPDVDDRAFPARPGPDRVKIFSRGGTDGPVLATGHIAFRSPRPGDRLTLTQLDDETTDWRTPSRSRAGPIAPGRPASPQTRVSRDVTDALGCGQPGPGSRWSAGGTAGAVRRRTPDHRRLPPRRRAGASTEAPGPARPVVQRWPLRGRWADQQQRLEVSSPEEHAIGDQRGANTRDPGGPVWSTSRSTRRRGTGRPVGARTPGGCRRLGSGPAVWCGVRDGDDSETVLAHMVTPPLQRSPTTESSAVNHAWRVA